MRFGSLELHNRPDGQGDHLAVLRNEVSRGAESRDTPPRRQEEEENWSVGALERARNSREARGAHLRASARPRDREWPRSLVSPLTGEPRARAGRLYPRRGSTKLAPWPLGGAGFGMVVYRRPCGRSISQMPRCPRTPVTGAASWCGPMSTHCHAPGSPSTRDEGDVAEDRGHG